MKVDYKIIINEGSVKSTHANGDKGRGLYFNLTLPS